MDPWIYWIIIGLLVFASGFFSGSETALASCNQFKFRVRASDNKKIDRFVTHILDRYNKLQISIVVENNIVNIVLSTIALSLFTIYFPSSESVATIVSTLVVALLIYVIGDSIPKIIARKIPNGYILVASFVLIPLYYLLWPINILFYLCSNGVRKIFKVEDNVTMTEEDFSNSIDAYEESGKIDEDESDIIQNALDFTDTSIKNVYTPLKKIYALDINDLDNKKLNALLMKSNYSRIPLYDGQKDNIVGILNVKTYFNMVIKNPKIDFTEAVQEPTIVTKYIKLDDIVEIFKKNKTHIALIKDKGKIVGMITLEDVLEELVGDMAEDTSYIGEEETAL